MWILPMGLALLALVIALINEYRQRGKRRQSTRTSKAYKRWKRRIEGGDNDNE